MMQRPPRSTLFPYTTLFRSTISTVLPLGSTMRLTWYSPMIGMPGGHPEIGRAHVYSSHMSISYAVFCLKKNNNKTLQLIMEKKILTYKDIDASILKWLPYPTCEAYEIKIKIPDFFFNDATTPEIYTLSLHDALPIYDLDGLAAREHDALDVVLAHDRNAGGSPGDRKSTRLLQSHVNLVCRLLLEKKQQQNITTYHGKKDIDLQGHRRFHSEVAALSYL